MSPHVTQISKRRRLLRARKHMPAGSHLLLMMGALALGACESPPHGAALDRAALDTERVAAEAIHDSAVPPTLINPQVVFHGTELDPDSFYVSVVDRGEDPVDRFVKVETNSPGGVGKVLHFHQKKEHPGWEHVMLMARDARFGYGPLAQLPEYGDAYHWKQKLYIPEDTQFQQFGINLLFDPHCEPCEANNIMLFTNLSGRDVDPVHEDAVCLTVDYSSDENFDARGCADRGGTFDVWPTLICNRRELTVADDGTVARPSDLAATGELWLCPANLRVSSLQGRWIDFEIWVKLSSSDSGRIRLVIDGTPISYDGPNIYSWNEKGRSCETWAVKAFQFGLYANTTPPTEKTHWDLYTTPPFIEIGDDLVATPLPQEPGSARISVQPPPALQAADCEGKRCANPCGDMCPCP